MKKVKITIRLNQQTNNQISNLVKDTKWSKAKICRFILKKCLSNNPNFNPNIFIKKFRTLNNQLANLNNLINYHNDLLKNGLNNVNQIAKVLNILVKDKSMIPELSDFLRISANSIHLKSSLKIEEKINRRFNQIWFNLNKKEV